MILRDCVIIVQYSCSFDSSKAVTEMNTKAVVVGAKITSACPSRAEWLSCVCCKFWNITDLGACLAVHRTDLRVRGFSKVSCCDYVLLTVVRKNSAFASSARFSVYKVCPW